MTEFARQVASEIASAAKDRAMPRILRASRVLARSTVVRPLVSVPRFASAGVYIPQYWAVMVHNGRGPFSKQNVMMFFRNPMNDPRLNNGVTPPRVVMLRRGIPQDEFRFWLRENAKADPTGTRPDLRPMTLTKVIRRGTPANRFFDNDDGMAGFSQTAGTIVSRLVSERVRSVPGVGAPLSDTATA